MLALLASLVGLDACYVGPLVPEAKAFLSVPTRTTLGLRTTVRASGSETSIGWCEMRRSDVADGRLDCSDYAELPAAVETMECAPAEACDSIKMIGAEGSFIPRATEFDLHVVARIGDETIEGREHISASPPAMHLLARARVVLRKPALEIGEMSFAIRSMEEVTKIETVAWAADPAKPAEARPRGKQTVVDVGLYAGFAGSDKSSLLPAYAITYRDGDIVLTALGVGPDDLASGPGAASEQGRSARGPLRTGPLADAVRPRVRRRLERR